MKGILMLLKSAGVNVTLEDMKKLEELIPKIPGIVQDGIAFVNANVAGFDARLKTLEANQAKILSLLESQHDTKRNAA